MRRFGVMALSALVLVAAGCGSSGSKGVSKADYIKKADAICKAGNDKLTAAAASIGTSPTAAQIKTFTSTVLIPDLNGQVSDLKALKMPGADKATIATLLSDLEAGIAKVKADPSLLTASGGASPFATANAEALKYGLKVCGAS